MKKIILLSTVLASLFLTSCNEKAYTEDDFNASDSLMIEYQEKCQNYEELKGVRKDNCRNYFKANLPRMAPR